MKIHMSGTNSNSTIGMKDENIGGNMYQHFTSLD